MRAGYRRPARVSRSTAICIDILKANQMIELLEIVAGGQIDSQGAGLVQHPQEAALLSPPSLPTRPCP